MHCYRVLRVVEDNIENQVEISWTGFIDMGG